MSLTQTGTLASLEGLVTDALQGRTDLTSAQIDLYLSLAIKEITESYPFEELRNTGPNFNLTTNVATYAVSNFLQSTDTDYTMVESFAIYVDVGTNSTVSMLQYKTPAALEVMIAPNTIGTPSRWTRFGSNIMLGPTPNAAYTVFMRYQARHKFSATPTSTDPIYVPVSWFDIIAYAAAERIAIIKRWNDQAQYLHGILYGDPEFQTSLGKRGRPGLIAARTFQQERDEAINSRQIGVRISRYTPR